MPREEKITCDVCRKDLTCTNIVSCFRLCLTAENIPHPPVVESTYFCGLGCLSRWVRRYESVIPVNPGRVAVTCSGRISDVKLENAS